VTPEGDRDYSVRTRPPPTYDAREPSREARELTSRGATGRERWNGETSPVQADALVVPHPRRCFAPAQAVRGPRPRTQL